jgi:hypothetical protein
VPSRMAKTFRERNVQQHRLKASEFTVNPCVNGSFPRGRLPAEKGCINETPLVRGRPGNYLRRDDCKDPSSLLRLFERLPLSVPCPPCRCRSPCATAPPRPLPSWRRLFVPPAGNVSLSAGPLSFRPDLKGNVSRLLHPRTGLHACRGRNTSQVVLGPAPSVA